MRARRARRRTSRTTIPRIEGPAVEGLGATRYRGWPLFAVLDPVLGETLLERYTVSSLVGEGGMGVVYRAQDSRGGEVAIKRVHGQVSHSPDMLARFQREASAQAMLAHPHIASLHAVGATRDGGLFFVMELVEGPMLAERLDDGPLELPHALGLIDQVLSGLHHAHQFGMVHRDLKPENVLLAPSAEGGAGECAKLIDFGLVKLLDDALGTEALERLTASGVVFGTPRYMAPEQIMGQAVDARTDLYAAGVLLFEMLTGRAPFEAEEVPTLWRMHMGTPPPSLASIDPRLGSPDLEAIVRTLLAKSPDERFQTAHAARRALSNLEL